MRNTVKWIMFVVIGAAFGSVWGWANTVVDQGAPNSARFNPWPVNATGAAADGAAVTGNPVLVAGQDGTNAQSLLTDTSGRPRVVGAAAAGAAVAGDPVLMGGSDGTNARTAYIDATNRSLVVSQAGTTYSSGVPTNVSVSTVSAAATGLTANGCYRVTCNVDATYRTGTGTPTAVTTDNDLPAKVVEKLCLQSSHTAIAFILASGTGTCKVGAIPLVP